jgi:hypothetical protein
MRPVFSWIFKIGALVLAIFLLSFVFSFSSDWQVAFDSFDKTKSSAYQQGALFSGPMVELDAKKFFGDNMTSIFANTTMAYLMVKNPEGPQSISTSTVSDLDRLTIKQLALAKILERVNLELKIFTEAEITVVPDSPRAIDNYLASIKKITDNYLAEFSGLDLKQLAYEAGNSGDSQSRKKLIDYVDKARFALEEFVGLPVPRSWKELHLELLNLYQETRYTALGFLLSDSDPVRATLVFNNYSSLAFRFYDFKQRFESQQARYFKGQ